MNLSREEKIRALEHLQLKDRLMHEFVGRYGADTLNKPAVEWSAEALQDFIAAHHGLPAGTRFSMEQMELICRLPE